VSESRAITMVEAFDAVAYWGRQTGDAFAELTRAMLVVGGAVKRMRPIFRRLEHPHHRNTGHRHRGTRKWARRYSHR
jgi:hypothetical protein